MTQTATKITEIRIGDFIKTAGTQNNVFTVEAITYEASNYVLVSGKSPQGRNIEYRAENFCSVLKIVEIA